MEKLPGRRGLDPSLARDDAGRLHYAPASGHALIIDGAGDLCCFD